METRKTLLATAKRKKKEGLPIEEAITPLSSSGLSEAEQVEVKRAIKTFWAENKKGDWL